MSGTVDSFFDVWTTLTIFIVFTGVLFLTFIAPTNVLPASVIFPKFVEVCDPRCRVIEIPVNILWGGILNGAVYTVLATAGFKVVRSIWRKKKK
jgi:hypothetical protein